jgi:hypothetical protein
MKRISRFSSVPLLAAAAGAAAVGIGLDTAAAAAADTTSGIPTITTPNVQLLQLQIEMQHGDKSKYTVVGNIMKTKHDTVKNSIGNIR